MPSLTPELERTLERTVQLAAERRHEYATLEHLLLALLEDSSVIELLQGCNISILTVEASLRNFIDNEMKSLEVAPQKRFQVHFTAALQRTVQRAVLHTESEGREPVKGSDILISLFAERDSWAASILNDEGLVRTDAVKYLGRASGGELFDELVGAVSKVTETAEDYRERSEQAERQLAEALRRISDLEAKLQVVSSLVNDNRAEDPDVFICYKSDDKTLVEQLVSRLRYDKFAVWWDADIAPGAPWEATIEKCIAASKIVVVCWSARSVTSDNVKAEARYARDRGKLIQVYLDGTSSPMFFGERQGLGFAGWDGDDGARCYQDLVVAARRLMLEVGSEQSTSTVGDLAGQRSS